MTPILQQPFDRCLTAMGSVCVALAAGLALASSAWAAPDQASPPASNAAAPVGTNAGNLAKWVETLKNGAANGDAEAATKLGVMYAEGAGVPKDERQAAGLYEQAAAKGLAQARYLLAGCYASGSGVAKDLNKAINLYEEAAQGGYATAQFQLGLMYESGTGVVQDLGKAAALYQKAANQDDASGELYLGALYEDGKGVPKNLEKAAELYQRASDHGECEGSMILGGMYENGRGVTKDLQKAAQLYRKAVDQGNEAGLERFNNVQDQLAKPEPDDFEKKYAEAMSYVWGMNRVHMDHPEAAKRMQALAKAECPEAAGMLAIMANMGGLGFPKDEKAAQKLAKIALAEGLNERATQGRAEALYWLGALFNNGLGMNQDSKAAWPLFLRAARNGSAIAQWFVGRHSQDPQRTIYWYEKSAAQGFTSAQYALGLVYKNGTGVTADNEKAAQLFHDAANQGHDEARAEWEKLSAPDKAGKSSR
ncbi:MAG: tetratricopeptide repeat protein [Chthoniobacter sp.]|nr:tetratricopeptide repeat protein [Chthoniobacter sp.]